MIAGIVGDVIGSVYEASQWTRKDLPLIQELPVNKDDVVPCFKNIDFVRTSYKWTDDTMCTLALYSAYINKTDPAKTLQSLCIKYYNESNGFGASFKKWLDNPVPYESFANGSIMRIGFIPHLELSLTEKISLGRQYTEISHNHADSFQAVDDYIVLSELLINCSKNKDFSKECLKDHLEAQDFTSTVESMHEKISFEMNALVTLNQAVRIVYESSSIEEVLRNCFYVGGDADTLACIACNLASHLYETPKEMVSLAMDSLKDYPELYALVEHFSINYL